jgi:hypothetical protein
LEQLNNLPNSIINLEKKGLNEEKKDKNFLPDKKIYNKNKYFDYVINKF